MHVSVTKVEEGIKRMKWGEATGTDHIASELWKAKSWNPTLKLNEFINQVIQEGRTPSDWQESPTKFQCGKGKVVQQNVQKYYQIRSLSHTMKIFERIFDNHIHEIVQITVNKAGFFKNCGTTDSTTGFLPPKSDVEEVDGAAALPAESTLNA